MIFPDDLPLPNDISIEYLDGRVCVGFEWYKSPDCTVTVAIDGNELFWAGWIGGASSQGRAVFVDSFPDDLVARIREVGSCL